MRSVPGTRSIGCSGCCRRPRAGLTMTTPMPFHRVSDHRRPVSVATGRSVRCRPQTNTGGVSGPADRTSLRPPGSW